MSLMLTHFVFAVAQNQPATNSESNNQTVALAPPMNESDRLSFMQDERATTVAESSAGSLLLRTLGAMLLIVGLIFCGAWGLKKFGVNFGLFSADKQISLDSPDLAILNSVNLGGGRTLSVVKFGSRNLLVGSTAQSFTLLADETENAENTLSVVSQNRSVSDLLAQETNSFAEEADSFVEELNFAIAHFDDFDKQPATANFKC